MRREEDAKQNEYTTGHKSQDQTHGAALSPYTVCQLLLTSLYTPADILSSHFVAHFMAYKISSDPQDMIAGVHKMHCTGDATRQITTQVERCFAHFLDGNVAAQGGAFSVLLEYAGEAANGPRRGGTHWPG